MAVRTPFLNIKPEEKKQVYSLILVLALATLVLELSDVIATGGFVSNIGPDNIVYLWIIDMIITIVTAGIYAMAVDKMDRAKLIKWLALGFALVFLLMRLLFLFNAPDWATYPLLYILTDQFYAIFPLAFWAMVNDLYTSSEAKRLYPIIIMGAALGSISGNGLAAISGWLLQRTGGSAPSLLIIGTILLLVTLAVLQFALPKRTVNARQSRDEIVDVGQTIKVGWDYIKNVPIFTFLAVSMLLSGLAFTIIEYHFIFAVDQAAAQDPLQFQTFYGSFKIILIVSTLTVQAFFSGRFLEKVGLKNSFIFQPAALAMSGALAALVPGLVGAAGAKYLMRLVQQSWDEPARKSLQNLIPDERRGRVAVMIDRYFYDVSTIVGSIVLAVLLFLRNLSVISQGQITNVYLGLAIVAALVAVFAGIRLRAKYEQSLLDWRLSRSRRKSALDGIEF
jgi:ATP:ADP antiporter, AAA family